MGQTFIACDRDQSFLMPPDVREWLPDDHLAWFVIDAVAVMDVDAFYAAYRADGHGRPAYEPAMMIALLLYGWWRGMRSSRVLERACVEDVPCRVIAAQQRPDHATIARFVDRHQQPLGELFGQVLTLCADAGLATERRGDELPEILQPGDGRHAWLRAARQRLERERCERAEPIARSRAARASEAKRRLEEELAWEVHANLQAELNTLEARREAAARLVDLRRKQRALGEEFSKLQTEVEADIERIGRDEAGRFGRLRRYFSEIIREVLGEDAIIAIRLNRSGGVDFTAEFVDSTGTATSADRGTSYRKLMCIAFDLAVLRTYEDVPFPRFVYHDGALEQLEQRKQAKLIGVFRRYADLGLQPIFSLLDKDLPTEFATLETALSDSDIVLRLHDEGESGRLFKMPSW